MKAPALSKVVPPVQKLSVPEITGIGWGRNEVVIEELAVQPFALLMVTVNVAAVLTEILCVVSPVDQR